jgi:hypothetical protein
VATAAGVIGQRIKAPSQKGFDPGADGLLVLAEMVGNAGYGPPGVRETDHFESVAGAGREPRRMSAASQLLVLLGS